MTYQAATSVYIVLAIAEAYRRFQSEAKAKDTAAFILTAILSFAAALLVFRLALMIPIGGDEYFSIKVSPASVGRNILSYLATAFTLFGGNWTKLFLVALLTAVFVSSAANSRQKKSASVLLTAAALILSLPLSFGAYIVFENPLLSPRAFIGFDFLVGLMAAEVFISPPAAGSGTAAGSAETADHTGPAENTANAEIKKKRGAVKAVMSANVAARISVFCLLFGCVVFHYAYGNALRDQRVYQNFRTEILLSDLNRLAEHGQIKSIEIAGSIGLSNGFASAAKTFPVIKNIISPLPCGGSSWNDEVLNFYNFNCESACFPDKHDFPLLLSTNYHDIYGKGNNFYIVLK